MASGPALLLHVERTPWENKTPGKLYIYDHYYCDTLEDQDRELELYPEKKVYAETAIPRGTYPLVLTFSVRFQQWMPEVLNVKGFSGVRLHSGNNKEDTEGCILVGRTQENGDLAYGSRKVYENLYNIIKPFHDQNLPIIITIS